jgi:hypothetical protein
LVGRLVAAGTCRSKTDGAEHLARTYSALRWAKMSVDIEPVVTQVFSEIELEKIDAATAPDAALKQAQATPHKRVTRAVPQMFAGV